MKFQVLITLFLMLALMFAPTAFAAELKGVTMPDTDKVGSQQLLLNGMGIREVSVLGIVVKIYVGGLYLNKKSDDAQAILSSKENKKVRLEFLHKVGSRDMKKNWEKGIKSNCEDKCSNISESLEKYKNLLPDIKSGDKMTYNFTAKGLELMLNDKPLGSVEDPLLSQYVLATWIGKSPVTEDLKRGLLSNNAK